MATAGPNLPTTASSRSVSAIAWTNPSRITAVDGSEATGEIYSSAPTYSDYLVGQGFGFSIPAGATVNGVTMAAKIRGAVAGYYDMSIRLLQGGVSSGTDKARGSGVQWPTVAGVVTWGGATDLWGLTLTVADVNDSTFGTLIQSGCSSGAWNYSYVDYVQLTVAYTASSAGLSMVV